jgi:hypothetical protein
MAETDKLKELRERDELEFKYQLRNLLKKKRGEGLECFQRILEDFKREIIYDSFFFMDILNETLFYFYREEEERSLENLMSLIHLIAPIGDRDSLEVFYHILKKLPRHDPNYPVLMNYYGEIEHKISFLEQKINKLKLCPPKSLIVRWYD